MATEQMELSHQKEGLKYEHNKDVVPLDKRELVLAELDAYYRMYPPTHSQTVLCECGRLTKVFSQYSFNGCSVCKGRRYALEHPTIKCNKCGKIFCRTHEHFRAADFHKCEQHFGLTEVKEAN